MNNVNYINYLAMRIANRTLGDSDPNRLIGLPDESLLKLVNAAAIDEWVTLSAEIVNRNGDVLRHFGMTTSQDFIHSTFNDIGENMMSNDTLNRAVNLLKAMRDRA